MHWEQGILSREAEAERHEMAVKLEGARSGVLLSKARRTIPLLVSVN